MQALYCITHDDDDDDIVLVLRVNLCPSYHPMFKLMIPLCKFSKRNQHSQQHSIWFNFKQNSICILWHLIIMTCSMLFTVHLLVQGKLSSSIADNLMSSNWIELSANIATIGVFATRTRKVMQNVQFMTLHSSLCYSLAIDRNISSDHYATIQ